MVWHDFFICNFCITATVTFQTARKYFNNTTWIVISMPVTLNDFNSHLWTDFWTLTRTEHLLIFLKYHMKMLDLFYSLNLIDLQCRWTHEKIKLFSKLFTSTFLRKDILTVAEGRCLCKFVQKYVLILYFLDQNIIKMVVFKNSIWHFLQNLFLAITKLMSPTEKFHNAAL
jgi:hypothetical protein